MILYRTLRKERLKGRNGRLGLNMAIARMMETDIRRKEAAIDHLTRAHITEDEIKAFNPNRWN